jgi:ribosome-binding factor A
MKTVILLITFLFLIISSFRIQVTTRIQHSFFELNERIGNRSDRESREKPFSKMDGIRQARIARAIRDELSEIICEGDIKARVYPDEDLLKSTCITDVEISPDLAYAKVFISVVGNSVERRQIFVWLCENVGQVRYELVKRLRHMKRVPDIFFKLSDNRENSELLTLIDKVSSANNNNQQEEFEIEEVDD